MIAKCCAHFMSGVWRQAQTAMGSLAWIPVKSSQPRQLGICVHVVVGVDNGDTAIAFDYSILAMQIVDLNPKSVMNVSVRHPGQRPKTHVRHMRRHVTAVSWDLKHNFSEKETNCFK